MNPVQDGLVFVRVARVRALHVVMPNGVLTVRGWVEDCHGHVNHTFVDQSPPLDVLEAGVAVDYTLDLKDNAGGAAGTLSFTMEPRRA